MRFRLSALRSALVVSGLALAGGIALHASPAQARVFVGVGIGAPFYWGPGYYAPYYYGPPVVYAPPPVVYSAPPQVSYSAPPPQFYYYCDNLAGYYPQVSACPSGWRQVQPPARQ